MRISTNSVYGPYERALGKIQSEKVENQMRLTTGRDIQELSDDPKRLINAKNFQNILDRNQTVNDNIQMALNEMAVVDEQLRAISDKLQLIQQTAIDATLTGNTGNLHALGVYVKGILEDIVRDANMDFNGHFVFSGTQTTVDSLDGTGTPESKHPFEIIQGVPTDDNRSGIQVVFKGNNNERKINKDAIHTETINATADRMFGGDGTDVLESIIGLYNLMAFNEDGTARGYTDTFSLNDVKILDGLQKKVADQIIEVNLESAIIGAKYKTLDDLRLLMDNEKLLLKDFLSQEQDTDIARSTLELQKAETALNYALQVGATIMRQSLFDYLR